MSSKEYKNIEDVLAEGRHNLKVYPKQEWDDNTKSFIKGSHKRGTSAKGFNWYLYQTKVGDEYISLFANDKNKAFFDTGMIEVNILHKEVKGQKMYKEGGVPMLIAFFNEYQGAKAQGVPSSSQPAEDDDMPF